jgi:hypothetical protein
MRFLSTAQLKTGDSMTPVVMAYDSAYQAPLAAIYRLGSDSLTGAVVLTTQSYANNTGVSPERQAVMLARSTLLNLNRAVDRIFWYEFKANENDPYYNEDHFGILHGDLTAKPAYNSYATLTRARPAGSLELDTSSARFTGVQVYRTHWRRPGSVDGWAVWSLEDPAQRWQLQPTGSIDSAFDMYGTPVVLNRQGASVTMALSEQPVYLFGPSALVLAAVATASRSTGPACSQPLSARAGRGGLVVASGAPSSAAFELRVCTLDGRTVFRRSGRASRDGQVEVWASGRRLARGALLVVLDCEGRRTTAQAAWR